MLASEGRREKVTESKERDELNRALGATVLVAVLFILLGFIFGELPHHVQGTFESPESTNKLDIIWGDPVFMPRDSHFGNTIR